MSNLLKKIIISLFTFLVVFTSIAPGLLLVEAQSPIRCGTEGEACCNLAGSSPNSCGTGLECTSGTCTAIPGETNTAQRGSVTNQSPSSAPSEGTWYNQDFKNWWTKVYDDNVSPSNEIFGERYTAAQVQWVIYSLWAFIFNIIVPPNITSCAFTNTVDLNACANEVKDILSSSNVNSNIASTSQGKGILELVFVSDRSFSGISYFSQRINHFSLVPEAYAQNRPGFGFNALQPIQNMWRAFRDIAYGLFVIVAIVFSFMIMFRVKISPQVVISVQSAIPKIIIALILVTFSYAIAGFLIDFMYVIIGILSFLLAPLIPTIPILQPDSYKAADVFNLLTLGKTIGGLGGIIWLIFYYLAPLVAVILILFLFSLVITGGLGIVVSGFFLILLLIVIIICLWMSVKIIFALFKAFGNVVLLTMFAPIQLALGPLVPNLGFGQWVKNYIGNLSVFVVTGVLWLFAWIFGLLAWQGFFPSGSGLVLPTATSTVWPPLLGSSNFGTGLLLAGVSLVFFTLIPRATEIVKSFISEKPFDYGSAIGEVTGFAAGLGQTAADYRSGRERARIETAIRVAENANRPQDATRLRRQLARMEIQQSLISQVFGLKKR